MPFHILHTKWRARARTHTHTHTHTHTPSKETTNQRNNQSIKQTTNHIHYLHWLPTEQRIKYKLSLLCFKIISHQVHIYLYTPSRQLRSSADTRAIKIPSFRSLKIFLEFFFLLQGPFLQSHCSEIRVNTYVRPCACVFARARAYRSALHLCCQYMCFFK